MIGIVETIKKLFVNYRKQIKFYAILFLVIVIIYIAVSPSSGGGTINGASIGNGDYATTSLRVPSINLGGIGHNGLTSSLKKFAKGAGKKCVCFPLNPVTHVWTK